MVTFTLSQSAWELAKSRGTRAMHDSVVYVPMCQRSKQRAIFPFWRANVSKSVPNVQRVLLRYSEGSFYTLLLYKNIYIIVDIIVIHLICICIIHKK